MSFSLWNMLQQDQTINMQIIFYLFIKVYMPLLCGLYKAKQINMQITLPVIGLYILIMLQVSHSQTIFVIRKCK